MSFIFEPLTDQELELTDLLEKGTYDFEVVRSVRKVSKKGNSMAELQINVWDKFGKTHLIYDYLVFSSIHLNIRKISHFCHSVGLEEEYKKGQIPEELSRLSGKVHIGISEKQPNPTGGFYPEKNVVLDYVKNDKKIEKNNENVFGDDVPF